jgi:hypothetical protein
MRIMVSEEWPAAEQPDCPEPVGDDRLGPIELRAQQTPAGPGERLGVYVCHCGGNISDYVDVEAVIDGIRDGGDVVVAKTAMFTCSDATQSEIVADIQANDLDGLVVASCSPKLHTYTFRGVAARAGLNPYEYTQVNIREQCSWVHTDDTEAATEKATALVRAGIPRTRHTTPLEPLVVDTLPHTLVIGGGIAGLRAAVGLADIGLQVTLVERELRLGGWVGRFGTMYPHDRKGSDLIAHLVAEVRQRPSISSLPRRSWGYIGPNRRTHPPSSSSRSMSVTLRPMSARPTAARRPAIPPPITSVCGSVSTTSGSSGVVWRVREMPARTSAVAFSVAASVSSVWTQEHCSRMLTCVYSYGFRPARAATPRNVYVWSLGEQDATTSPSSSFAWMSATISDCVASEQVNIAVFATTTSPLSLIPSMTASTST